LDNDDDKGDSADIKYPESFDHAQERELGGGDRNVQQPVFPFNLKEQPALMNDSAFSAFQ
jgi:hypothetical protein